ncbi:MAG: hypothetical protein OQK09_11315 [Colwellia sp.]|nr:hypothetical protein [Colwellia sp.]MCW8865590.1 hypothetical protein [Colwellia sp.]MCW9082091.1 hypothetical protein [Colwellia sp.]
MSTEEINKIETICQQSTPQCLALLEVGLNDSQEYSRQWYRFKQLRLVALFELQRLELLQQEINQWLVAIGEPNNDIPPSFAVYIYIYHAKLLVGIADDKEVNLYLNKAVNLLSDINSKLPSPLRLIEIANLQISMHEFEKAKLTLLSLESKFKERHNPIFKQELYANLGHIAWQQDDKNLHIEYRQKSLKWALEAPNTQQKSVAHINLAFAYQKAELFKDAEINYRASLKFAELIDDDRTCESARLRLLEVVYLQDKIEQAKSLFNNFPRDFESQITTKHNQVLYQELKAKLVN